jgi:nitrile hydratase accessory protein
MSTLAEQIAADRESIAAIPRRNGEPVFDEPWESRVFGMAVGLCERGRFAWEEFRARLLAEITAAEARGEASTYYERFLRALQGLLIAKGICSAQEVESYLARGVDPGH